MPIDRWTDKEGVVHTYNGILLSHKKEHISVSSSEGDELESGSHSVVSDSLQLHGHGILWVRILEWIAFPFSRGSSQPRGGTQVSHIPGGFFTSWVIREAHKKEHILVSSREADELRVYYIEWSESEREKQTPYTNTYIRNLEKWYWWIYFQGRNRYKDIKNRVWRQCGEGVGANWESSVQTYTLPYVK